MSYPTPKHNSSSEELLALHGREGALRQTESERWAIILAGEGGTRLRSLTRRIAGDERPKQFCRILDGETLIDSTRKRVALVIAPEQTMFVMTKAHQRFYAPLLNHVSSECMVVQPINQGTAPAILYGLLRLAALNPHGSVAFFPSDHYFADDKLRTVAFCDNAGAR